MIDMMRNVWQIHLFSVTNEKAHSSVMRVLFIYLLIPGILNFQHEIFRIHDITAVTLNSSDTILICNTERAT